MPFTVCINIFGEFEGWSKRPGEAGPTLAHLELTENLPLYDK